MLFGQITKIVDESTRVPLADPQYRHTYYGFAALAVPVIALVYFIALISASIHHDSRALVRATAGLGVAAIGGFVYVLFAQFLVALDDWLAHGVVVCHRFGLRQRDGRSHRQVRAGWGTPDPSPPTR